MCQTYGGKLMYKNNCGYLSRIGVFIDCSNADGQFKHISYCDSTHIDEEYVMDWLGWVKLTTSIPQGYVYTSMKPMSKEQIEWLENNGYVVDYTLRE